MQRIKEFLNANKNERLAIFNRKLITTGYPILGVAIPSIRKFLKTIINDKKLIDEFTSNLKYSSFEEYILCALIINEYKEVNLNLLDNYLDYVDNWAMCDILKVKNIDLDYLKKQLSSDQVYRVRFSIVTLLYFNINKENTELVLKIKSDQYFINMAIAWYLTTAISKDFDGYIKYLSLNYLNYDVFKMTIRKCLDSYKLTYKQKEYIKRLKRIKNEVPNN